MRNVLNSRIILDLQLHLEMANQINNHHSLDQILLFVWTLNVLNVELNLERKENGIMRMTETFLFAK